MVLAVQGNPAHPGVSITGTRGRAPFRPAWEADLRTSLGSTSGLPSAYSATSAGRLCPDNEGILRRVNAGEARFWGARRVENLVPVTDWVPASLFVGTITEIEPGVQVITGLGPAVSEGVVRNAAVGSPLLGRRYACSVYVKALVPEDVGKELFFNCERQTGGSPLGTAARRIILTANWTRYATRIIPISTDPAHTSLQLCLHGPTSGTNPATQCVVYGVQAEEISGASNGAPSEYVHPTASYGVSAGGAVVGVRYFDYANGNSIPSGDVQTGGQILETRGAPITDAVLKGLFHGQTRTNLITGNAENWSDSVENNALYGLMTTGQDDPRGRKNAAYIEDTSATDYYLRRFDVTVVASTQYTLSLYVKKDAIGRATRFVLLRALFSGGTTSNVDFRLDTNTGEFSTQVTSGTCTIQSWSRVVDCGGWWRIEFTVTNDATGNTSLSMQVWPAAGAAAGWTYSGAATGGVTVWGGQIEQSYDASSFFQGVRATDGTAVFDTATMAVPNAGQMSAEMTRSHNHPDLTSQGWGGTMPHFRFGSAGSIIFYSQDATGHKAILSSNVAGSGPYTTSPVHPDGGNLAYTTHLRCRVILNRAANYFNAGALYSGNGQAYVDLTPAAPTADFTPVSETRVASTGTGTPEVILRSAKLWNTAKPNSWLAETV